MVLRKLSQSFKITLALMLSVFSSGILQVAPAYAKTDDDADKQVYCNIEGDSGKWKAQISNGNTEHEYPLTGVFVHDQNDVTGEMDTACATQYGTISITVGPSATNPTCEADGQLVIPTVDHVTWTGGENGDGTGIYSLVATADKGYEIVGQSAWNVEVLAQLTGEDCEDLTPVTPDVVIVDVCGIENDSVTGNIIAGISYDVTQNGLEYTVTASPVDNTYELLAGNGFTLNENGTATRIVTLTTDLGCPTPVTPENPDVADLCGRANDAYTLPQTAHITYEATKNGNKLTIVATADQGYVLELGDGSDWTLNEDGTATYSFTFTNVRCERVTICHRTNSATNPYRRITVSVNAVDGIAGNSGKQADHYGEHKGPLATSTAAAQLLKDNKIKWGDIIPPVAPHHEGYNWTTEGRAIYDNDCNLPGRGGEMPEANISAAAICTTNGVKVTLTNAGDADGSATVNGETINVVAGESKDVVLGFDLGTPFNTHVTVTFGDMTLIDQVVDCNPGQGGGQVQGDDTTKPQTLGTSTELPAALPSTGGEQNPMLILLASLMAYGIAYLFQGRRQLNQTRA